MSGRSRHSLLGKIVRKPKDGTNKDVLEMTKLFLDHERANKSKDGLVTDDISRSTAASPIPVEHEIDAFLAEFDYDLNDKYMPPKKKQKTAKKGGRKRRKSRKKKKTRRKKKKSRKKRGGNNHKNFKKNLLENINKKEKKLKPMINSIINKYYKGKKKMSYSVLKKVIEKSDNKVLEKVGKKVKEIMEVRKSVMKGGAGDEISVIPQAIISLSFCFIVCFMLYVLLSFFDAGISRFYIMSQGGYQQMIERRGWREADNEISRNIKKIKREIVFLVFLMCIKSSINNYYEAQERMRQFRLLSPHQQQRVMIEHQERINRQNAELQQFNEELDELRDFWDRMRGSTNLNRNLDVQRMIRDIRSNRDISESKREGKE